MAETMNKENERQHYVSQVLLSRFKVRGSPLQCYQVRSGEWKGRSVERVCSAGGYNQLLLYGQSDNSLESSFSKIESRLPETFRALEDAATRQTTQLPQHVYQNLCRYCAFLKLTSLFSKASAVVNFVAQVKLELDNGKYDLLRELGVARAALDELRNEQQRGRRIIVEGGNVLQMIYQIQFRRCYALDYGQFLSNAWTVSRSPMEIPLSDIGLVPVCLSLPRVVLSLLPISPTLLLEGVFQFDISKNSQTSLVLGRTLTKDEAEYRIEIISASAVKEIVCSSKVPGIQAYIQRAKANGTRFHRIADPLLVASSGLKTCGSDLRLRAVAEDEYVRFVHSFVLPPEDATPTGTLR